MSKRSRRERRRRHKDKLYGKLWHAYQAKRIAAQLHDPTGPQPNPPGRVRFREFFKDTVRTSCRRTSYP